MKLQYKSLLMAFGALAMMTSCGNRDILEPIVDPGQEVPTTYWEVGSTAAPAGGTFTFQGKYTIPEGRTGDYSEVWYRVKRAESAAATVKLAGAALSYTKTATSNDTMRNYQPVVRKLHSEAEFNGYEYVVKGEVPVSRTLSPVTWIDATTWDAERFARVLAEEEKEAEKERIRAERRAANPDGITTNTSKKKQQQARQREQEAQRAAAAREYAARKGEAVEEPKKEKEALSGIADRPFCKGRAYDPDRYKNTEE